MNDAVDDDVFLFELKQEVKSYQALNKSYLTLLCCYT